MISRLAVNQPLLIVPTSTRVFRPFHTHAPQTVNMASTTPFLTAIASRRSVYVLSKKSPITNTRILELVSEALKHAPSPFNVRSTRAIVLFGAEHEALWEHAFKVVEESTPGMIGILGPKIKGFVAAQGTVRLP